MKQNLILLSAIIFWTMFSSYSYGATYQTVHTLHSGFNNSGTYSHQGNFSHTGGIHTVNSGSISGNTHLNPIPTTIHTQPGMLPPPTNVMPGAHAGYGINHTHRPHRRHIRHTYGNNMYPRQYYYTTTYSQPYMYTTTMPYAPVTSTYTTSSNGFTWTNSTQQRNLTPWQRFLNWFDFW